MRKIFISLGCLFLLTFLAPTLALSKMEGNKRSNQQALFVLLAKEGTIHEMTGKPGQYQLLLKSVNPEMIYFADRPARFASHLEVTRFIKQWREGSFKTDPPNAVVEAIRLSNNGKPEQKRSVSYAIVLTNPSYDKAHEELRFDIKPLNGNTTSLPVMASSDYVALFVDNACITCF